MGGCLVEVPRGDWWLPPRSGPTHQRAEPVQRAEPPQRAEPAQ